MKAIKPKHTEALNQINKKIVAQGEILPTVKLKDGSTVQTGTVATMLFNIKQYDSGVRGDVERELALSIPTLFKVGLFDLFSPEEWINGQSRGRQLVGKLALKHLEEVK
jgi:hypothetical protein